MGMSSFPFYHSDKPEAFSRINSDSVESTPRGRVVKNANLKRSKSLVSSPL